MPVSPHLSVLGREPYLRLFGGLYSIFDDVGFFQEWQFCDSRTEGWGGKWIGRFCIKVLWGFYFYSWRLSLSSGSVGVFV